MTESGKTEEELLNQKGVHSFGERLFVAREKQGLDIVDISKAIHLSEDIIEALERSDVDKLPQPTFVQGYLRTYAKHLCIPADPILEEYSNAVPHARETDLHPRSVLPDEANSGSPFVKFVTIILLITILLAAIYGLYTYYSKMVKSRNDADSIASLALPENNFALEKELPGAESEMQNDSEVTESNQYLAPESLPVEEDAVDLPAAEKIQQAVKSLTERLPENQDDAETAGIDDEPRNALVVTKPIAEGDDALELIAQEDSWTEVVDANEVALLYDLVQQGRTVVLRGTAPFDIFLGNAPAMQVSVNGIKIDMTKFVRSNKIAHFTVSTNDQQVVFH